MGQTTKQKSGSKRLKNFIAEMYPGLALRRVASSSKFAAMKQPQILAAAALALFSVVSAPTPAAAADSTTIDTRPVPFTPNHSRLPADWQRGAFMEIFVRAWRDSDGDGIGDLRGLTQSLPYLQDLGIRGIWLMPITKNADGDHGYATTDFRDIAPEYGSLADLDELLRQAHRRGIGVIMDYVINHSAASHPMFVAARQGEQAPFRDWYVWANDAPQGWDIWGNNPWYLTAAKPWDHKGPAKDLPRPAPGAQGFYFGTFGPHMPDFNFRNPAVLNYHLDSLRFWLNRGLDGFRLDAVPHLIENNAKDWNDQPESRALSKRLQDEIKRYDKRMVVCEATAEPQAYGDPAVCGGAFAFGYVQHIVKAARGELESVAKVADYFSKASPTMASFVSNHDLFAGARLWDQVQGDVAQYKLAAATYLLQPGTPFIYYGEEIGQAGVATLKDDPSIRSPMSWQPDAATGGFTSGKPFRPIAPNVLTHNVQMQRADPRSIFNFYKAMLKLRHTRPSLLRGNYQHSFAKGWVAGWQRQAGAERSLVLFNYGPQAEQVLLQNLPSRTRLRSLNVLDDSIKQTAARRADARGELRLDLPPQSLRVFALER
jgi:alpha-amylase